MKKILVCEDEDAIRDFVVINLTRAGYEVTEATNGEEALQKYDENNGDFDVAILDIMMPGIDGLQVCKELRNMNGGIGIIMLSARTQEMDKVTGLMLGADDYITKPFSMEELVKRVEAIMRRVRGKKNRESSMYKIGRFTFDTQKQLLVIGDKQTKLTTKENELLALLCSHANEILKRNDALRTIWIDDNYFNARSMDVYITKLRKHLKDDDQIEIINIHGQGYKLIVPEED